MNLRLAVLKIRFAGIYVYRARLRLWCRNVNISLRINDANCCMRIVNWPRGT